MEGTVVKAERHQLRIRLDPDIPKQQEQQGHRRSGYPTEHVVFYVMPGA
jgi:hypothetical protein